MNKTIVQDLGTDPQTLADQLRQQITPAGKADWEKGDPKSWATESYGVAARSVAYTIGSSPGCTSDVTPLPLPAGYEDKAKVAAALRLSGPAYGSLCYSTKRSADRGADTKGYRSRRSGAGLLSLRQ